MAGTQTWLVSFGEVQGEVGSSCLLHSWFVIKRHRPCDTVEHCISLADAPPGILGTFPTRINTSARLQFVFSCTVQQQRIYPNSGSPNAAPSRSPRAVKKQLRKASRHITTRRMKPTPTHLDLKFTSSNKSYEVIRAKNPVSFLQLQFTPLFYTSKKRTEGI